MLSKLSALVLSWTSSTLISRRLSYKVLMKKLRDIGMDSALLDWIASYLSGRSQFVKLMGHVSETFDVTPGVPQGIYSFHG